MKEYHNKEINMEYTFKMSGKPKGMDEAGIHTYTISL